VGKGKTLKADRHWSVHTDQIRLVLSAAPLGIISDFDGTLSCFVKDPSEARITRSNKQALDLLVPRVNVLALVSGRSAEDLYQRYPCNRVLYYGNHGLEYWANGRLRVLDAAQPWREPLQQLVNTLGPLPIPGTFVESKGVTATVHYRGAREPARVRDVLRAQLQPLCDQFGFKLREGNRTWEMIPPISINKGTAIRAIILYHKLKGVIFLGDDTTDLSAMDAIRSLVKHRSNNSPLQALSVGVIHPRGTPADLIEHCDVTANEPADVATLLMWIAEQLNKEKIS
jgi:trehalose 6-phosphate phosphatase